MSSKQLKSMLFFFPALFFSIFSPSIQSDSPGRLDYSFITSPDEKTINHLIPSSSGSVSFHYRENQVNLNKVVITAFESSQNPNIVKKLTYTITPADDCTTEGPHSLDAYLSCRILFMWVETITTKLDQHSTSVISRPTYEVLLGMNGKKGVLNLELRSGAESFPEQRLKMGITITETVPGPFSERTFLKDSILVLIAK